MRSLSKEVKKERKEGNSSALLLFFTSSSPRPFPTTMIENGRREREGNETSQRSRKEDLRKERQKVFSFFE